MKNYRITINGKTYEVGVEEYGGAVQVQSVRPEISVAPAPAAAIQASAPAAATQASPAAPAPQAAPAAASQAASTRDVTAPMPGTVLSVAVSEGQQIQKGQLLLVFEAMKMENEIVAPDNGTVAKIHVSKGTVLEAGMALVSLA